MTSPLPPRLAVDGLLGALEGVAYAAADDGTILAVGRRNWDAALARNGGRPEFRAEKMIGRNLFEFIDGEAVAQRYRSWMRTVRHGRDGAVAFAFRCDAPTERRDLRMAITRLEREGHHQGFLFHSTALSSTRRPPIDLFDVEAQLAARRRDLALPQVTMCSFCHSVDPGERARGDWLAPEAYYAAGGRSEVRISHGICPACTSGLPA